MLVMMSSQKRVVMESPIHDTNYLQHKQYNPDTGSEGPAKKEITPVTKI